MLRNAAACVLVAAAFAAGCGGFGPWKKPAATNGLPMTGMNAAAEKGRLERWGDSISQSTRSLADRLTPSRAPAVAQQDQPAELRPSDHITLARHFENQGDFAAAESQFRKALALRPGHAGALLGLARLCEKQGQLSEAEGYYAQAVRAAPQLPAAWNDFGLFYAGQRQFDRAQQHLARAAQIDPHKRLYRHNLATVHLAQGDIDSARQQLLAVHDPAIADYNLGYLLYQQGRVDEAKACFEQSSAALPNGSPAAAWLAAIESGRAPAPGTFATDASQPREVPEVADRSGDSAPLR
jgi:Tfp pilus assembly protein PilF